MTKSEPDPGDQRTFIVGFWAAIFAVLRWVSLLQLLRGIASTTGRMSIVRSSIFVEAWALAHLLLALVAVVVVSRPETPTIAGGLIAIYAVVRTFEISITQLNIVLFDEYRAHRAGGVYRVRGYRRMVVLLLQNFAEVVLWFAAAYVAMGGSELLPHEATFGGLIRESFLTTVSFGSSAPQVTGANGLALIAWQGVVGLLITLLSLARFIGLLPRPGSFDPDDL